MQSLSLSGKMIVVNLSGLQATMLVDTQFFLIVGGTDQTPAADSKSGQTDATGSLQLTSKTLASGTYHVQSKTHPSGGKPDTFNGSITIP